MSDNCIVCEVLMQCRELAGNVEGFPFHCAVCKKDVGNDCEAPRVYKDGLLSMEKPIPSPRLSRQLVLPLLSPEKPVPSPRLSRQLVLPSSYKALKEESVSDDDVSPREVLDDCFYIPRTHDDSDDFQESALREEVGLHSHDEGPVRFEVLEKGTKRGGRLLVASDGFTYTCKRSGKFSTRWRCSVRSKKMTCYASIFQRGNTFSRGESEHCHPGDLKLPILAKVSAKAKEVIQSKRLCSARDIVQHAASHVFQGGKEESLLVPHMSNLIRTVNRHRAQQPSTVFSKCQVDGVPTCF